MCQPYVILDDNVTIPSPPNLNSLDSNNDIKHFIVWDKSMEHAFLTFEVNDTSRITAIVIEFLNYPAQNISLPKIQIFKVQRESIINPSSGTTIDFITLDNEDLSDDDFKVTKVTLRPLKSFKSSAILFTFSFDDVYSLDYFMMSEIEFCLNSQPAYMPNEPIHFKHPQSSIVTSTFQDFSRGFLVLNCTIEAPGSYAWIWSLNDNQLHHSSKFQIFRADAGGRVSRLVIVQLSLNDAGTYRCQAVRRVDTTTDSAFQEQQVIFPGKICKQACVVWYML